MNTKINDYSFYGRLKKRFPSQIIVDVTENCNYACKHCPHANFEKSDIYTGANLPIALVEKLINEVKENGGEDVQQIRYTANGEPLLHPDIFDILTYSALYSGTFISLTTNGSLLTSANIDRLLATNINLIDISLDANSNESYQKIRINGNYEKVKNNVLLLLKKKQECDSSMRIIVSFVKQPLNEHETDDFKKFWKDQGVDYVVIRNLHSASGAIETKTVKPQEEKRTPCVYPWERITLNGKGELEFCPTSWLGKATIADYRNITIKDIWQSEFYIKLREMHIEGVFPEDHACNQCMDWKITKWPDEGKSYGDMIAEFKKE